MRLICPNCDAQYEVADGAIPAEGRDVQCSNCGHAWFQLSPEVEAAQEAEAALFDAPVEDTPPDPQTPPNDYTLPEDVDVDEAADFLPEDDDETFDSPAPLPRRSVDEGLLAVLREEAEREAAARKSESPRTIETQPDLGLDAATGISASARRIAQMKGIDPDVPPEVVQPATRGELLPDIEEINSTLRASTERAGDDEVFPPVETAFGNRNSFRSGFVLMLILGLVLLLAYVMAPRISQQIPGSADTMASYVAKVDSLRLWLDNLLQKATSRLQ